MFLFWGEKGVGEGGAWLGPQSPHAPNRAWLGQFWSRKTTQTRGRLWIHDKAEHAEPERHTAGRAELYRNRSPLFLLSVWFFKGSLWLTINSDFERESWTQPSKFPGFACFLLSDAIVHWTSHGPDTTDRHRTTSSNQGLMLRRLTLPVKQKLSRQDKMAAVNVSC